MSDIKSAKEIIGICVRPFIFISVGAALLLCVVSLLRNPKGSMWAIQTGMELVHSYRNQYDVLEVGTSTVIANISNQELYENYGIRAVSIGEPEQPVYLSRFTLADALQKQSPKTVILDSKAFFYSEETNRAKAMGEADYILHNSIDPIRDYAVKREAVKKAMEYNPDIEPWDYYSRLYYTHGNWKSITEERWKQYTAKDFMNGNIALFSLAENVGDPFNDSSETEEEEGLISESAEEELRHIIDLCEEHSADLILVTGYITFTKAQHRAMQELADRYELKYIDVNEISQEIGLDNNTDIAEGGEFAHFNLLGALKWTDYLGQYLSEKYQFPEERDNVVDKHFDQQKSVFQGQKEYIQGLVSLVQSLDFQSYLNALNRLDRKKHIVFFSVYDEGTLGMSDKDYFLLEKLGLYGYRDVGTRENYVAVLSEEGLVEQHHKTDPASIEGEFDSNEYLVSSGGFYSSDSASIRIAGIEYMQKGRGMNIVVYDRKQNRVISSVFFDTYEKDNPLKQRFTTVTNSSSTVIVQSAAGPNQWEDVF